MKNWIKAALYALAATSVVTLSTVTAIQHNRISDLQRQVTEQSRVIDSLLTIRRNYIDVDLIVTDKSTSKIYGRYNKGTITMPSERTYRLEIDSVSLKIK